MMVQDTSSGVIGSESSSLHSVDEYCSLTVRVRGGSGRNPSLFAQDQLLKQQKCGRFPDESEKLQFTQVHSGVGHRYKLAS